MINAYRSAINAAHDAIGRPHPTEGAVKLQYALLKGYPIDVIKGAIRAHLTDPERGNYPPTPADIIRQIQARIAEVDGRPGREEAWCEVLRLADESQSGLMTEEMAEAAGACAALLKARDRVAGRLAFVEVYDRHVSQARQRGAPVRWSLSLGDDPAGRSAALSRADAMGVLPGGAPDPGGRPLGLGLDQVLAIGMESGHIGRGDDASRTPPPEIMERLLMIRDESRKGEGRPVDVTPQLKAKSAEAVADFMRHKKHQSA